VPTTSGTRLQKNLLDMRILVTGGRGMVGKNLLEQVDSGSHEVFAPTKLELDLTDAVGTVDWMKKHEPDLVIHAAAVVGGIQANINEPVRFLIDNIEVSRNVILAARKTGVNKLINIGASCMYPRFGQNPLREESIQSGDLEPTNEPFAIAKIFSMRLCEYIQRENPNFNFKTVIPCNLYGRHDTFDNVKSHLLPAIITKLHQAKKTGEMSVEIWGPGTARREFMYAADFCEFLWLAVEKFDTLPIRMNVGVGYDMSVNEYYELVASVVGYRGSFCNRLDKPVGMKRKLVDIEKLAAWGWSAKTSLRDGVQRTYDYFLETNENV